jgi:hypothetical protein
MRRIRVTIYYKSGLAPARYVFDTWQRCFTWLHTYMNLYREDIAKVTVKRKGIENEI